MSDIITKNIDNMSLERNEDVNIKSSLVENGDSNDNQYYTLDDAISYIGMGKFQFKLLVGQINVLEIIFCLWLTLILCIPTSLLFENENKNENKKK